MAKTSVATAFCILFMSQMRYVLCYTHENMTTLMNDLLNESRYSKAIRPIHIQDRIMQINITPGIVTIEDLDMSSGELLTIATIKISWIDEYLIWNPEHYKGIVKLNLPLDQLWVPSLSQFSGFLQGNTGQVINPGFAPTVILHTGAVLLVTSGYYATKCDIDTSLYPFDRHRCNFIFFSGLHDISEVELNSPVEGLTFAFFEDSHVWSIENTENKKIAYKDPATGYSISGVQFTMILYRRPTFELINSYIPIFLLASLNIASNFVPPNSGERLSFAITLYLSFIFLTSALISNMPHVATNIAISSYVMLSLNVLNTANVLWSVFIVRLFNWQTGTRRIPNLLIKMVSCCCRRNMSRKMKVHPLDKTHMNNDQEQHADNQETVDLDGEESNNHDRIALNLDEITWLHVAEVLDKIYLAATVLLYACAISVTILYWMLSK